MTGPRKRPRDFTPRLNESESLATMSAKNHAGLALIQMENVSQQHASRGVAGIHSVFGPAQTSYQWASSSLQALSLDLNFAKKNGVCLRKQSIPCVVLETEQRRSVARHPISTVAASRRQMRSRAALYLNKSSNCGENLTCEGVKSAGLFQHRILRSEGKSSDVLKGVLKTTLAGSDVIETPVVAMWALCHKQPFCHRRIAVAT